MTKTIHRLPMAATLLALLCLLAACAPVPVEEAFSSSGAQQSSSAASVAASSKTLPPPQAPSSSGSRVQAVPVVPGPFDPYVPLELPPEPYQPVTDLPALYGDWHHYVDPASTDMVNPTVQVRLSQDRLTLSYGTLETDAGVFYHGNASFADGVLTARLYGEGPDRTPRTTPVDLQLVLEKSDRAQDILVVTLQYVASQDPDFETWFGIFYNVQTPYIRYGA